MHSSGKNSLAVGLSPYKIAKIDAFASKLAGRFFHHFAWLVAFTNSSQKISTQLLTVLIISVILQLEQRKRDTKRGKKEKDLRYPDSTQVPKKQVNSKWSGSRKHWTKIEKER